MLAHDFGIIKDDKIQKSYNEYRPLKYGCIKVNDDSIQGMYTLLNIMKTYHHSFDRKELGLAYHGITLIPYESQAYFMDSILRENQRRRSEDLDELALLVIEAMEKKRTIIHFGI